MEDWSLQAIVRGSSIVDVDMNCLDSFLGPIPDHGKLDLGSSFPEIFEASTGWSNELEDLYKPHVVDFQEQINTVGGAGSSSSNSKQVQDLSTTGPVAMASSAGRYSSKYKRRKNQHKRVVIKVSAEGLASDMWAWRKYGQKPIKGSPYPRSYYRCSSSKGCLARKQVEQSCTDPGMFIVTYTAEHSHSQPTRRNSLAGTVRQKFPSAKTKQSIKQEKPQLESPVSPQIVCHHQIFPIKEDQETEAQLMVNGDDTIYCEGSDGLFRMPSFDDLFSGLEEFISDLSPPSCQASAQQFPV